MLMYVYVYIFIYALHMHIYYINIYIRFCVCVCLSVFFIEDEIHFFIDVQNPARPGVPGFLIKAQIALLLQDRFQTGGVGPVDLLRGLNRP